MALQVPSSYTPRKVTKIPQPQANSQVVEFSAFKKRNAEIVTQAGDGQMIAKRSSSSVLALLAGLSFIYNRQIVCDGCFKQLNTNNVPKLYVNYMNDKTLEQFYSVFKSKITSLETLGQMINFYPITSFFLDLYARQIALFSINDKSGMDDEMMGNEYQLFNDLSIELRGNALDLITKALRLNVNFKYGKNDNQKFIRRSNIQEVDQNFGTQDYCALVEVKFAGKDVFFYILEERTQTTNKMRKSRIQLLQRKSRTRQNQMSRVSVQSKSMNKQIKCEYCGKGQCECLKKVTITPKGVPNLNKSISAGFAVYHTKNNMEGLNFGFINMNKINSRQCRCKILRKICHCNETQ